MKIEFFCNSGANHASCKRTIVDVEDIGLSEDEWNALTEDEKMKEAEQFAWNSGLEIGFKEVE